MPEKYSQEQMELLLQILIGDRDEKEAEVLISDEELSKKFIEMCEALEKDEADYDDIPGSEETMEKIFLEFARRTDKKFFDMVCELSNEEYIRAIVQHPEFYENGLTSEEIQQLVLSTKDVYLMRAVLNDTHLVLTEESRKLILEKLNIIQPEKLTYDQMETMLQSIGVFGDKKDIALLISDEELAQEYLQIYSAFENHEIASDSPELKNVIEKAAVDLAKRIDPAYFPHIYGKVPEALVKEIITHPEFYDGALGPWEIENLVIGTNSLGLMQYVIGNETIKLDVASKFNIEQKISELQNPSIPSWNDQIQAQIDELHNSSPSTLDAQEVSESFGKSVQDVPVSDSLSKDTTQAKKIPKALEVTEEEKKAIKIYESDISASGDGTLGSSANISMAYKTMNTLLFPGIDNEIVRIFEDNQYLIPDVLRDPQDLLKISTDLYSAMYKSGRTLTDTTRVLRMDRSASLPPIEEKGEIVSNFSTTTATSYPHFKKAHITLIEADIEPRSSLCRF